MQNSILNNLPKQATSSTLNPADPKLIKEYKNVFNSGIDIVLYHSNITEVPPIECLVNCTGPNFEHYAGISNAITQAAGPRILDDYALYLANHKTLHHGYVHQTKAHNLLQHKHILHIRSPSKHNGFLKIQNKAISACEFIYFNILKSSFVYLNTQSIATPLIGTGIAGILVDHSTNDLLTSIQNFSKEFTSQSQNKSVLIVNNDATILKQVEKLIEDKFKILNSAKSSLNSSANVNIKIEVKNEDCAICLDQIRDDNQKKLDKCGHMFCADCINSYFEKVKKICPLCNTVYGTSEGDQPIGTMSSRVLNQPLPGYDRSTKTIEITYSIPSGTQGSRHPSPGQSYHGTTRVAYLPDTSEGQRVLGLLRRAFDLKLIFTVGQSRTTGMDNVVTWNDIHHKTSMHGGSSGFGYPDPTYLTRVVQELADKGVS